MKHWKVTLIFFICAAVLLGACSPAPAAASPTDAPKQPTAAIANPASVFCGDHGGKLEIVTADDGSQSGTCTLPDGTKCDEWAYFRGECGPATQNAPQSVPPAPGKNDPEAADHAGKLAAQKLAADLKVDLAAVTLTSTEMVAWPDSCLGLGAANESCAAVETPGFRVLLAVGDQHYTFHTDYSASSIRQETAGTSGE